jgi:hypothetical protein
MFRPRARLLAVPLLIAIVAGAATSMGAPAAADAPAPRRPARRLTDARGVAYAAEVAPGIYRGGQPTAEGIAWLKSIGVRTVLNLRHYHGASEKQMVESVGLHYERIAMTSLDEPKPEQVARFLALVRDPALRPIYVHCEHGVDRTGAMMAVYRMEDEGWSNADAYTEMESFGAHLIFRDLRNFVKTYRPQGRHDR